MEPTGGGIDWVTAIAMLLSGLVIGALILYKLTASNRAAKRNTDEDILRRDLQAKADALVQELRELEDAAGGVEKSAHERYTLELQAAAALRQLAELGAPSKRATAPAGAPAVVADEEETLVPLPPAVPSQNAAVKGFAFGVITVVALAGLGFWAWSSAKDRGQGEGVTGGTMMGGGAPQAGGEKHPGIEARNDPALAPLQQKVRDNPDDLEARLQLAKEYLVREDMMDVFTETQAVLAKDPQNPRALTYEALVRMAMGQLEQSREMLTRATKGDPTLLDAWAQLAVVNTQLGDDAAAEKAIAEAVKQRPDQKPALEALLQEVRNSKNTAPQQQPAMGGAAAAPAQQRPANMPMTGMSGPDSVSGEIDLASTAQLPPTAALFVLVRGAGVAGGPPIAAVRVDSGTFPARFGINSDNSMMGQDLPATVRVEARLDSDGNPMTHGPGDLTAIADNVKLGTHDLKLKLK